MSVDNTSVTDGVPCSGRRLSRRHFIRTVCASLLPPQAAAMAADAASAIAPANRTARDRSRVMSGLTCVAKFIADAAHGMQISRPQLFAWLDAAAQTKFEPARAGDTPVAVNVVWLLAQTRVRGRIAPPPVSPIERPRTISRSGESSDAHPARVSTPATA